jgi:methyl-accepting chemotaxis protein
MRRDQFSRDSSFAVHLLLATLSMSAAFMVVAGAMTFVPAVLRLEFGGDSLEEIAVVTQEILDIHAVVWPVVVACLIAVAVSSLILFNRMTEPLFRFVKIFESIGQGSFPAPIELRGRDYLRREAKALNDMVAELQSGVGDIKRSQIDLSGTIEEIAEALSQNDPDQIARLVSILGEQDKSLQESVARFGDPS